TAHAAKEPVGQMLRSRLAGAAQDAQQLFANRIQLQGFLNVFRQAVLDADPATQLGYQHRTLYSDQLHPGANLVDSSVVSGGTGLLAESHKSGAQQALQFGIFFGDELLAELSHRLRHGLPAETRVKIGHLANANGSLPARFGVPGAQTTGVIIQNLSRGFLFLSLQEHFYELP